MSKSRRDKRRRVLRMGETQMKSGLYRYSYTDESGKRHDFYSWKLEKTDPLPPGRRPCKALREKIQDLMLEQERDQSQITVSGLVKKCVSLKGGVRYHTRAAYQSVVNLLEKDPIGKKPIGLIRLSDAKLWMIRLQEGGKRYTTINTIHCLLRQAFRLAIDDELLNKNPFDFCLSGVIQNDSVERKGLSAEQEEMFLRFLRADSLYSKYYDAICILFRTGLRISEFCGLTVADIDLTARRLTVERQLLRTLDQTYMVQTTKTKAGKRVLPIDSEACECFQRILEKRSSFKVEPIVDGISGFLYLDKNHKPLVSHHWEYYFKRIVERYSIHCETVVPKITPHVCRHTYCTRMVSAGMNPKVLQYLMGHSNISSTMNVYTHMEIEEVQKEFRRVSQLRSLDDKLNITMI